MSKYRNTLVAVVVLASGLSSGALAEGYDYEPIGKGFAPPPAPSWTGVYVGVHGGYGWGDKDWVATGIAPIGSHDVDGWLGGGQLGLNYQTGLWVFGVEGEFGWADLDGAHVDSVFDGNNRTDLEWLGTVAGRIGYAWGRSLPYVKAGGAWVHDEYTVTAPGFLAKASDTKLGWMIGTGLEYALMPNWSTKVEYNYLDFGTERVTFRGDATFPRDVDQHIHAVKIGVNYRFDAK